MVVKIFSLAVNGLQSDVIESEVDIQPWLPSFTIVWLPDQWVQESKERLRSAIKSSNFKLPTNRITVNLAPADIRKSWPSFDVCIAVGILSHIWEIQTNAYTQTSIFLWELSLDGSVRWVSGILPSVIGAKQKWFSSIFVPYDNYFEASIIEGIEIFPVQNMKQLVDFLNNTWKLSFPERIEKQEISQKLPQEDFQYILWQHQAKRALEIAAAGLHNIILSGPPWSGKTLLAKAFSTILPDLTLEEKIEISKIYSVSWLLSKEHPVIQVRPFRTVHHTASAVSIVWGWTKARPWEISLAHKWVLFLDEVLEFPKPVLEVLRQPIEDGCITVNRVNSTFTYPAKFVLLWAMNPCPCGYLTDPDKNCIDTPDQIKRYRAKLSGPMMDRIDIMIEVPKVKTQDFSTKIDYSQVESSTQIKQRVEKARQMQLQRFSGLHISSNSEMTSKDVQTFCQLDEASEALLKQAVSTLHLSARAYYRVIKLARTIADLWQSEHISIAHIAEALSYRKSEE